MEKFLPAAAAFVLGAAVSFVNFILTRSALNKGASGMGLMPLRVLVAGAFMAALYFAGDALGFDTVWLLVGGALGMTVGLTVFTLTLMKNNKE